METSQLVHSEDLYEKDGLIFFKKQLYWGVFIEDLSLEDRLGNFLVSMTCIKDGKKIGQYLPPYFPKELFDLKHLQYMWITKTENGQYGFPDDFNYPDFTGIVFQGEASSIPMPHFPTQWATDNEWEDWDNLLKEKENINYPLTLDELPWGGRFYAVINGKHKIDGKVIYKIDNISGPNLDCIINGVEIKIPENTDLFDINFHI
ncbi:MAG: hypothetical protein RR536_08090 [Anaerovoracaceae bacterium]